MDKKLFRLRVLEVLDAGMSVAEFSRKAGVKYDIIRDLKRRENASTSVENAQKIAEALGLTLDQFINGQPRDTYASQLIEISSNLSLENRLKLIERATVLLEDQEAVEQK